MGNPDESEIRKNFNRWSLKAQKIHFKTNNQLIFKGEIWWAHVGQNIGWEQNGGQDTFLRPVVVIRCFREELCWVVPTTKTIRSDDRYFFDLYFNGYHNQAILSQLRAIDTKRLHKLIGEISEDEYEKMIISIRRLLEATA